jgi:hypothetical protein
LVLSPGYSRSSGRVNDKLGNATFSSLWAFEHEFMMKGKRQTINIILVFMITSDDKKDVNFSNCNTGFTQ